MLGATTSQLTGRAFDVGLVGCLKVPIFFRGLVLCRTWSVCGLNEDDNDEEEEDDKTKESTDLVDEDMHVPLPQVKKLNIKNLNIDDDMDQDEYVVCVCVLENVIEKSHTHP